MNEIGVAGDAKTTKPGKCQQLKSIPRRKAQEKESDIGLQKGGPNGNAVSSFSTTGGEIEERWPRGASGKTNSVGQSAQAVRGSTQPLVGKNPGGEWSQRARDQTGKVVFLWSERGGDGVRGESGGTDEDRSKSKCGKEISA